MQLKASYTLYGRHESMTFYARVPHPPAESDCIDFANAYGLWESLGFLFPVGYSTLRSSDSEYSGVAVRSLDPLSNAVFIDRPFSRGGLIPGFAGAALATSLAPLIYWLVAPDRQPRGRTYAVGLTEQVSHFQADKELLDPTYQVALHDSFDDLRLIFDGVHAAKLCHVSWKHRDQPPNVAPSFDIVGVNVPQGPMGTQRRRTRRGR